MREKAVVVRCIDCRHTGKLSEALGKKLNTTCKFYEISLAGGSGILVDLAKLGKETMLEHIRIGLTKTSEQEVFLTVHGVNQHDMDGCAGYTTNGFEEHFQTPEKNRYYSHNQLQKALQIVGEKFPNATVRAFYVTFAADGENIVEEVLPEAMPISEQILQTV